MLSLLDVQISAAISLAAAAIGFALGAVRGIRGHGQVEVIASRSPAAGTQAAWIIGTVLAIFWPAAFFLAPNFAYHWPTFPDFRFSWLVQIVGVLLGIGGGLLYSKSARSLGPMMSPVIRVQRGHQLVQNGPYRFVRHPIYTAIILLALGQTLLFLSLPAAVLTGLLVGLAIYRAGLEERLLGSTEGFGAEYADYTRRTGRFLPHLAPGR